MSRPTAEEFWAVVDERVFELVEAGDMWQAYEIAMEVAGLVFRPEWEGVIDFDGAFYCAWMECSDVFDAPWWYERVSEDEADRMLRTVAREWLATPFEGRGELVGRWQANLAQLAKELSARDQAGSMSSKDGSGS